MIIKEVSFKQYGSYRNETVIPFHQGTTGIIGIHDASNLRSNAAGKSTAIRAINFALYGKDEGKKIDSIVNDKVPANEVDMYVSLKFNHGGIDYVVTRGRKKTSSHLYFAKIENGAEVEIGETETDIRKKQTLINDVIGMDFDMFTATVFFEQRKADKFINTESSKSQEYLDNVLNLDTLRAATKLAATKINKLLDSHKQKKSNVETSENSIKTLTEEVATKDSILKSIEDNKKSLEESSKALEVLIEQSKSFEESEQVLSKLSAVNNKIKVVSDSIVTSKAKIVAARKKVTEADEAIVTATSDLKIATSDVERLTPHVSILKDTIEDLRTTSSNLVSSRSKFLAEKNNLQALLSNIDAPKCPHCSQDITNEYREQTTKLIADRVESLDAEIDEVGKQSTHTALKIKSATEELALTENTIKTANTSITNANNKISNNKSIKTSAEKDITDSEASIKMNESLLIDLTKEQQELKDKAEYIKTLDVSAIKSQMQAKTNNINAVKASIEALNRSIGSLEEKERNCEVLKSSLEDLKKSLSDVEDQIDTFEIVSSIFKKMVDEMFSQSVKLIEYYANKLIQQVYPNFKINIYKDKTKKLEPIVFDFVCDGKSREYDRLSGGQKTVADICLRLGFSKTLMDISSTKINFICLDEPFESLDEYNRELIKQILMFESRTFSQVIIISHTPDAQDFEHLIRVRMSPDGVSYIER